MNHLDKEFLHKWLGDKSSLTDKDNKAFEEYLIKNNVNQRQIWNELSLDEIWQAACEYKQKEIDARKSELEYAAKILTDVQADKLEMRGQIQKLAAENESLKDGSYWQSDIERLEAENAKLRKVILKNIQGFQFARMILRESNFHGGADDMTDYIDLAFASLKELDEKL